MHFLKPEAGKLRAFGFCVGRELLYTENGQLIVDKIIIFNYTDNQEWID
jgi:hypothetical protein